MTNVNAALQDSCALIHAQQNRSNISTSYSHQSTYSNRLDLYLDINAIGFIDYRIKDALLKKISISQISIDAYYQKNGLGSYLIECLKKEFDTITLLSVSSGLNMFYEKNDFEEDLCKAKQKNTTNYVWNKQRDSQREQGVCERDYLMEQPLNVVP